MTETLGILLGSACRQAPRRSCPQQVAPADELRQTVSVIGPLLALLGLLVVLPILSFTAGTTSSVLLLDRRRESDESAGQGSELFGLSS